MFELDPVGRPVGVTAGDRAERYAYDDAGNQTDAHRPAARSTGSCGERAYEGTRLLGADGLRYEYDDAGRVVLRQKRRPSRKPDTWRYAWDAEDRLVSCTTQDGTEWHYTYDAVGRRTAKHRMAADGSGVVATVRFTWEGTQLAEETDSTTGVTLTWEYEGLQPMSQLERRNPPTPHSTRWTAGSSPSSPMSSVPRRNSSASRATSPGTNGPRSGASPRATEERRVEVPAADGGQPHPGQVGVQGRHRARFLPLILASAPPFTAGVKAISGLL
ncbi:hypothetical protein [Streptomyces sp. NPDC017964]|uniref:hypothetical protein n=1 Tax=Streptomyces sp. NPDC017964 TaxID=3365022 RepID=UPI00379C1384